MKTYHSIVECAHWRGPASILLDSQQSLCPVGHPKGNVLPVLHSALNTGVSLDSCCRLSSGPSSTVFPLGTLNLGCMVGFPLFAFLSF